MTTTTIEQDCFGVTADGVPVDRYTLTANDELRIDYRATADQATPVSLTHHGYFNLAGGATGDVLGHVLDVLSTEPAVVLYTGNYLDGTLVGKGGVAYRRHAGLCLETAHLPDSVNRPEFPSIILRPGATYTQTCVYRFGVEKQ